MNKLLAFCLPQLKEHLSDDRLIRLSGGELNWFDSFVVRRHLGECIACRTRLEHLERRAERVMLLFELDEKRRTPARSPRRHETLRLLYARIDSYEPRWRRLLRWPSIPLRELSKMDLALGVIIALAVFVLVPGLFWVQQRTLTITSGILLASAQAWDKAPTDGEGGVIHQVVRITALQQTTERSIYRDARRKRHPRIMEVVGHQALLKNDLATAGIEWDEPLSASSYRAWHDQQRTFRDKVSRSGRNLLMLRTTASQGPVAEQTLTVREADFHPVRRTVAFRNSETVEIAEVDYKVLPWSAIDQNIFDPLNNPASPMAGVRVAPAPSMPLLLTAEQLDEAELGARLVLNQMHADTNEQLEITRNTGGVVVQGWVETGERKRKLEETLRLIPYVAASIHSAAELKEKPDAYEDSGTASMPDHLSPLETFLQLRKRTQSSARELGQGLFNAALIIGQESRAIDDLQKRFGQDKLKTVFASAAYAELLFSHRERLESALDEERKLLNAMLATDAGENGLSVPGGSVLLNAAERNLSLCKELIATDVPAERPAETILAELQQTSAELVVDEARIHARTSGVVSQNGRN